MLDCKSVANEFIKLDKNMPPIKLLMLTYLANCWNLGINKSPLIKQRFEAWKNGPICVPLYRAIKNNNLRTKETLSWNQKEIIMRTWVTYRYWTAKQLLQLTVKVDSPWWQTPIYKVIKNKTIECYYQSKCDNS